MKQSDNVEIMETNNSDYLKIKECLSNLRDINLSLEELASSKYDNFKVIQIIYMLSIETFNKQEYEYSSNLVEISLKIFQNLTKNEFLALKDQIFLQFLFYDFMRLKFEILRKTDENQIEISSFVENCFEDNKFCFEGYKKDSMSIIQFLLFFYHKIIDDLKTKKYILIELIKSVTNKNHLEFFLDLILQNKDILPIKDYKQKIEPLNQILWFFLTDEILNKKYETILNHFITCENLEEALKEFLNLTIKFSIISNQNYDKIYFEILKELLEMKTVFREEEIDLIKQYGSLGFKYKLTNYEDITNIENFLSFLNMNDILNFIIETKNYAVLENILTLNSQILKMKVQWQLLFITFISLKKYKEATKILETEKISTTTLINKEIKEGYLKYEILFEYFSGIENYEILKFLIKEINESKDFLKCFKILMVCEKENLIVLLIERGIEINNSIWILHCLKFLSGNMKKYFNIIFVILEKIVFIKHNNKFLQNFVYNFTIEILENNLILEKSFLKNSLDLSIKYLKTENINIDFIEISLEINNCLLNNNINVYIKDIYNLWEIYNILESKKIDQKRKDHCLLIFYMFFSKENFINDTFKCFEKITKNEKNLTKIFEIEIFYGCKSIKMIYKIFEESIKKELIDKIYVESCLYLLISIGPMALIDFLEFLKINILKQEKLKFKDFFNEQTIYLLEKQIEFLKISQNFSILEKLEHFISLLF